MHHGDPTQDGKNGGEAGPRRPKPKHARAIDRLVASGEAWWDLDTAATALGLHQEASTDLLCELDLDSWIDVFPDLRIPCLTLTMRCAEVLQLEIAKSRGRAYWRHVPKTREPRVARLFHGYDVRDPYPGLRASSDPHRPSTLIGEGLVGWDNPSATGETLCRACRGSALRAGHYCLRCDRTGPCDQSISVISQCEG